MHTLDAQSLVDSVTGCSEAMRRPSLRLLLVSTRRWGLTAPIYVVGSSQCGSTKATDTPSRLE